MGVSSKRELEKNTKKTLGHVWSCTAPSFFSNSKVLYDLDSTYIPYIEAVPLSTFRFHEVPRCHRAEVTPLLGTLPSHSWPRASPRATSAPPSPTGAWTDTPAGPASWAAPPVGGAGGSARWRPCTPAAPAARKERLKGRGRKVRLLEDHVAHQNVIKMLSNLIKFKCSLSMFILITITDISDIDNNHALLFQCSPAWVRRAHPVDDSLLASPRSFSMFRSAIYGCLIHDNL